jgi:hypothetical protein
MAPATELSPEMSQMFNSFEKMPSPTIFKTHLPFYLLHPELLDTSKVNLALQYYFCLFSKSGIQCFVFCL